MKNFSYILDSLNLARTQTPTLSETSQNGAYPAENVIALPVSKPFRSADAGLSSQKTLIEFSGSQTIDTIALVNTNLRAVATITIKGGSGSDPSSVVTGFTFNGLGSGTVWAVRSSTVAHRYWSITLTDAGHSDNFLSVGYLVMGVKVTLSTQFLPEWTKERVKVVRRSENEIGVPMIGSKLFEGTRVGMTFGGLSITERNEVDSFLDSMDLGVDPLLFIPDYDEADGFYGRLEESHIIEQQNSNVASIGCVFITHNFGLVVT